MLFVVVEERTKEMSEEKLPINVNHCTIFPLGIFCRIPELPRAGPQKLDKVSKNLFDLV